MTTEERCIGCDRSVAVGSGPFASRVRHGDGFLCADCADVLRGGGAGAAADARVLERIREYGLGSAGGRTGGLGGGPG
jgi:hypothetical protein